VFAAYFLPIARGSVKKCSTNTGGDSSFHDGRSDGKLGERKHREDKDLGELHVEKLRLELIGQDLIF
jgi:hypothetical protein